VPSGLSYHFHIRALVPDLHCIFYHEAHEGFPAFGQIIKQSFSSWFMVKNSIN